jgi:hypothetical protein
VRTVVDGVLVSTSAPPLRLRPAPALRYLGADAFELKALAAVERHHFVEDRQGSVTRMLVVHFESFLPGVRNEYRYRPEDPREIAGAMYGVTTSLLDLREELNAEPEAEMAHTVRFLAVRGLRLPERQNMARFARIVGDDRRSELLIFHHEIAHESAGLLDRALAAFAIEPESR